MRVEMNCILLTSGKQAQDEMVQFIALIMCIKYVVGELYVWYGLPEHFK